MAYRTRTYIAGDWDHDYDAVEMLHYWNDSSRYGLSFSDAHDLRQARDTSLNCSIKKSLSERLNASKTFVLIIGTQTTSLRAGSCQYCGDYRTIYGTSYSYCSRGNSVNLRSYIDFECEKAFKDGLNIIVLYKSTSVEKSKCPEILKNIGIHTPMKKWDHATWKSEWDYQSVKLAFDAIKK